VIAVLIWAGVCALSADRVLAVTSFPLVVMGAMVIALHYPQWRTLARMPQTGCSCWHPPASPRHPSTPQYARKWVPSRRRHQALVAAGWRWSRNLGDHQDDDERVLRPSTHPQTAEHTTTTPSTGRATGARTAPTTTGRASTGVAMLAHLTTGPPRQHPSCDRRPCAQRGGQSSQIIPGPGWVRTGATTAHAQHPSQSHVSSRPVTRVGVRRVRLIVGSVAAGGLGLVDGVFLLVVEFAGVARFGEGFHVLG